MAKRKQARQAELWVAAPEFAHDFGAPVLLEPRGLGDLLLNLIFSIHLGKSLHQYCLGRAITRKASCREVIAP
ncbi:MAG TPA: hypothetical protein PKM25_06655 [Candidatus Ozemobacteraceae bacterium]|nr:hypothetical protein [Candidatus Ozemobacteraceae bacterium]